jgi:DDE_Tnp_1-associated/Transposase DDE domain
MQLFECLETIPDPRKKRGIRHPFQSVLKLVLLGFTCRLVAIEHMVAFFTPHWMHLKKPLGFTRSKPPNPTTIRRVLNGLKPEQLQKAFEQWVQGLVNGKVFIASVDGKAMRNAKGENGLALMLVNVFAHDLKLALAEYAIKAKEGEPTVLKEALTQLFHRYPGLKILVGDAAFSGRELNEAIILLGRDYIAQVKENQPKLKKLLEDWFQAKIPKGIPAAVEVKKKGAEKNVGNCGLIVTLGLP